MKRPSRKTRKEVYVEEEQRDDAIIGTALRWSGLFFGIAGMLIGGAAYWVLRPEPPAPVKETELADVQLRDVARRAWPSMPFTDITQQAGIRFRHENGARGSKLLPETMGGGCAFLDFDNDGDQDLLFVNSQRWPWDETEDVESAGNTMALYRNDGTGGFDDVTQEYGMDVCFYGMGAAVGDYDNDGFVDLFISALGRNHLFHNEQGVKFQEVTDLAGVAGETDRWSASCGWFDYDRDGDLDLFVCNYLEWSREYDAAQNFQLTGGGRAYGRPQNFAGTFPYLYRNEGDGSFSEVAEAAGLCVRNPATDVPLAKSLGVTFLDCDRDGWMDILVANDTVQNFLFHNQRDGTFRDVGAETGIAFDVNGNARGAMGIDAACFRNNTAVGVAIGNFSNEMTALYVAYDDTMRFMDEAVGTGLGPVTRLRLTFGLFYFDCDLDSRLDLFAANGHLETDINRVQVSQHYAQPPQLFWNCGHQELTEFQLMTETECGADLTKPIVGRGAAYADIDGDGDLDVLITAVGGAPRLLRNDQREGHHWVRFQFVGDRCNRDAIGTWVEIEVDGRTLRRQVMPTRGYLSQSELPVTIGVNQRTEIPKVWIQWPDGQRQLLENLDVDRTYVITQSPGESDAVPELQDRAQISPALRGEAERPKTGVGASSDTETTVFRRSEMPRSAILS
jgi:hypothetical protein